MSIDTAPQIGTGTDTGMTNTGPHTESTATSKTRRILQISMVTAVLLIVLIVLLFLLVPQESSTPYDLDNPGPDGSQALGRVLDDHGVEIRQVYNVDGLETELERSPDATVVLIDRQGFLAFHAPEQQEQVAQLVPDGQLVIANDSILGLDELVSGLDNSDSYSLAPYPEEPIAPGAEVGSEPGTDSGPQCEIPAALAAGPIQAESAWILVPEPGTAGSEVQLCYLPEEADFEWISEELERPVTTGGVLARDAAGNYVLTTPDILTNRMIALEGNAALALWLTGQNENLIWYTPDQLASVDSSAPLNNFQIPDWARFGIYWLIIVFIVIAIWLGRRHGPVVVEPLPSEVKPAEITVGRARVHARGKHSNHALAQLQQATLRRLAKILRTGTGATDQQIIAHVAATLHRPVREIAQLFAAPPPGTQLTDKQLVAAGQALKQLENDVSEQLRNPISSPTDQHQERS